MNKIFRSAAVALSVLAAVPAFAQNTRSGYFLDDYTYRYEMNPAFANSRGFVAMPGLANINVGVNGTLGLNSVLYNVDGRTTTFLNPGISTAEALKNIKDVNRIGFDTKINILSFGFKAFGGYNTISLNARAGLGIKLPGDVFSLLKEGISNKTYHIANLDANANAFAELSFGHSRQITSEWRVGANFKFLIGGAHADVNLRKADLTLGTDSWTITTDGEANVNLKGFTYKTELSKNTGNYYVNGADVDGSGVGGFGIAFDLGAVYTPEVLPDWEFSAAFLDLGFISWSNNMLATTNGEKTFNTDKYTFNVDDNATNSFDNEWDKIKDDLSTLYELENAGDTGSKTKGIGATMNLGAKYTLPVYHQVNFGLLNTTRIQGKFSWTDFRLSANYVPCKIFDCGVNASAGTFGMGFGWIANLHCPGFNLFVGMDRTLGKLAKQGIPLNSNGSFNLGMTFLIK